MTSKRAAKIKRLRAKLVTHDANDGTVDISL